MKRSVTFLLALLITGISIASAPFASNENPGKSISASEIYIPVGSTGNKISLLQLSTISKTDLEALTGNKMSGSESRNFYRAQKKIKKGIDENGVVTNKQLMKLYGEGGDGIDGETGFHLGGFALGLFLSIIGVLIAYLIKDGKKKNRTKWAWIGLIASLLLGGLFLF